MIKMPWTEATQPNAMIEIADACNVRCGVCFHRTSPTIKPMAQIRTDLDHAMQLRDLHTVTISGGEPTLHPELCDVVRMIKGEGLHVFLLTNGVLIDPPYLHRLKLAGLDSILFHVDAGQHRSDLPHRPVFSDIKRRLDELVAAAVAEKIDVSISTTVYDWSQLEETSAYFMAHRDITFLFLSKAVDCTSFFERPVSHPDCDDLPTDGVRRVIGHLRDRHRVDPFSYIPTRDGTKTVWISYFVPILYNPTGYATYRYCSNWIDVAMMRCGRILTGRYVHKTTQKPGITWFRVGLNALARLRPGPALSFWFRSRRRGWHVRHKMIVYDDGPYWNAEHRVQHCAYCPTAIVRNGALVPCCTADYGQEDEHRAVAS